MNSNSRTKNSIKNVTVGLISQLISYGLSFVSRTLFIHYLGVNYLGINGLYTSVLTVLSLAELGIGNVLIFLLYKPIADGNRERITAFLHYFKKIYRIIAFAILGLGLALIPFLGFIVKSDLPFNDLILYYVLFLLNSVVSYFVIYKTTLINSDQKIYITKIADSLTNIFLTILQIAILIVTKNYVLYLCAIIVSSIVKNICLNRMADKMYPYIKNTDVPPIEADEKKAINKSIKSMFFYKAGTVLMNQSTNILISIILGTIIVGYYSNYTMIMSIINGLISILISSVFSSLGHLNAGKDGERANQMFDGMVLFFHWLGALTSICFLLIYNDFITIWIGTDYLLDNWTVAAIVCGFYLATITNQNWMYRETLGMFNEIKYTMLYAAAINIVCAVILGNLLGLPGILISVAISRLATVFWYEPKLLYEKKFDKPVSEYWIKQGRHTLATIVSLAVSAFLCGRFPPGILMIVGKVAVIAGVTTLCFLIFNFHNRDLEFLLSYGNIFKSILKRRRGNRQAPHDR